MEYMSNCDFYEIRLGSILSDSDRKVLIDLYQPIIGAKAIALYFKLWSDYQTDFEKGFYTIDKLLTNMQVTTDEVLNCRRHLEAMGLIRTYVKAVNNERKCYLICLYSPKQPKDFFDDIMFKELLIKYIGERETQKIINHYRININHDDYDDVSASFGEVFCNEMQSFSSNSNLNTENIKGKESPRILNKFDKGKFLTLLHINNYLLNDFLDDEEILNIAKLADVYNISEEVASQYFNSYCKYELPKGKRINDNLLRETFKNLSNYRFNDEFKPKKYKVTTISNSNEEMSDYIKLVEHFSPVEYLKFLNNNEMPLSTDLKVIESINSLLPSPIINVIISYTLDVCNNKLTRGFVESVVDQIRREGINSAGEAINFLSQEHKRLNNISKPTKSNATAKRKKKYESDDEPVEYREDLEDEDE